MGKIGRPTKYNNRVNKRVMDYTKNCQENDKFPTIEELASILNVGTRTIYEWIDIYDDFSQTIEMLRDLQRQMLVSKGLKGEYNSRFSIFLLKANHKFRENEPLINTSQNNNFNISPDLLADALKLMREEDGS